MGKTYKEQANYFRFKDRLDEAPKHLQEKAEIMNAHYKGYRFGDDRRSSAKSKVQGRKSRRNKEHAKGNFVDTDDFKSIPFSKTLK